MKPGALFPNFKAWSNFRLMLVMGSIVTLSSLALGAVVVQAALSNNAQTGSPDSTAESQPGGAVTGGSAPPAPGAPPAQTQATAPGAVPLPELDNGETFRVSCAVGERTSTQTTCEVESFNGFARRVDLSCRDLPPNLHCNFTPSSVIPRANGATTFRLQLIAGQVPPGDYVFDVVGQSGSQIRTHRYPWGLNAPKVAVAPPTPNPPAPGAPPAPPPPAASAARESAEPTFSFTCGALTEGAKKVWSLSRDGETVNINCFLSPLHGFDEPVTFEFAQPVELAKPDTVSFLLDQLRARKLFDLTFELSEAVKGLPADQLQAGRDYVIEVTGTSESGKSLTKQVIITITE